jgi:hypothetical protein
MAPPILGIGPPTMMVQAQPVSLCISLAASSIVRGSLSMFLTQKLIIEGKVLIGLLTSAKLSLDRHFHLHPRNPPCIAPDTLPPASWPQSPIDHTILAFSCCGSRNDHFLYGLDLGLPPDIVATRCRPLT